MKTIITLISITLLYGCPKMERDNQEEVEGLDLSFTEEAQRSTRPAQPQRAPEQPNVEEAPEANPDSDEEDLQVAQDFADIYQNFLSFPRNKKIKTNQQKKPQRGTQTLAKKRVLKMIVQKILINLMKVLQVMKRIQQMEKMILM